MQLAWGVHDGERLAPALHGGQGLYGIFNVAGSGEPVPVQLPDGDYLDLIGGTLVRFTGGTLPAPASAVVLSFGEQFDVTLWTSTLLDVFLHVETLGDE